MAALEQSGAIKKNAPITQVPPKHTINDCEYSWFGERAAHFNGYK